MPTLFFKFFWHVLPIKKSNWAYVGFPCNRAQETSQIALPHHQPANAYYLAETQFLLHREDPKYPSTWPASDTYSWLHI